ncbi:UNVERIFIED_CONTAM: hypothetical protein PYX00_010392 [Menopon gallinae]|uniref:FAM194 C-terminal domain-containing protein n=1 Tax=Menopon gallinae TaxID=328185 RepID=A0AAW2HF44_9NEOP
MRKPTPASTDTKSSKPLPATPSIAYRLSNEMFRSLGWTSQPENAIVVPIVTMKAKFSRNVISPWFITGKSCIRTYKDGQLLCVSNVDGTGRIFYPNGKVAVIISKTAGNITRIVVKTPGGVGRDGVRRRSRVCGVFDSLGNGVVYDEKGKKIVYDQKQGFLRHNGNVLVHWRWHNLESGGSRTTISETVYPEHRMDPAAVEVIKKMGSNTAADKPRKSRNSLTPTTMWGSEEDGVRISDESHYINTSQIMPPSPIRPISFQMSPNIGIHIQNQAEIALVFFANGHLTRLNIGILYNPYDKLEVTTNEVSKIIPGMTASQQFLQADTRKEKKPKTDSEHQAWIVQSTAFYGGKSAVRP